MSYEIGTKNNIANRVQLSSSVYYINWNNIQQRISLPICGLGFVDNLGSATAKGIDLQGLFRITDALTLNIAAGYTEARFTDSVKLSPKVKKYIVADGDAIQDANGNPTPPFTGTIGLDYRFNLGAYEAFIHADDSYTSAPKWIGPGEDPSTSQYQPFNFLLPSRNQLNMRAGLFMGLWEIDAFVNNLPMLTRCSTTHSRPTRTMERPRSSSPIRSCHARWVSRSSFTGEDYYYGARLGLTAARPFK